MTIKTNIRTQYIASNLLYKYTNGNNIRIDYVNYELFHLLVTIDASIPNVHCGVVVIENGIENSADFNNYLQLVREHNYVKESPDNMPILVMRVNSLQEKAEIAFLLGWSANFEPVMYSPLNWRKLNEDVCGEILDLVKSMNRTITILSLPRISLLQEIDIVSNGKRKFCGKILYARKNTQDYQIKPIKNDNYVSDYCYKPKYELDELDYIINNAIEDNFKSIANITRNSPRLLLTSNDLRSLQLFSTNYGYKQYQFDIRLLPNIDDIDSLITTLGINATIQPITYKHVCLFMRGDTTGLPIFYSYEETLSIATWLTDLDKYLSLKESIMPIEQYVNIK